MAPTQPIPPRSGRWDTVSPYCQWPPCDCGSMCSTSTA
jgi:hypothetical protein